MDPRKPAPDIDQQLVGTWKCTWTATFGDAYVKRGAVEHSLEITSVSGGDVTAVGHSVQFGDYPAVGEYWYPPDVALSMTSTLSLTYHGQNEARNVSGVALFMQNLKEPRLLAGKWLMLHRSRTSAAPDDIVGGDVDCGKIGL